MGWYDEGLRRYVRRRVPDARGRLVWVDADGQVWDLGEYAPDQIAALHTGVCIAYRTTPERSERTRLAATRLTSERLARAIRAATQRK